MSDRLTTPRWWPASSMTGEALYPLSARKAITSSTVASSWIDTGFGVINWEAVAVSRSGPAGDRVIARILSSGFPMKGEGRLGLSGSGPAQLVDHAAQHGLLALHVLPVLRGLGTVD